MTSSQPAKPLIAKPQPSLSKKSYDMIKRAITNFTLKPGTPLVEEQLAQNLNFSRTPIREALKRLHNEGLVKIIPQKGAFVAEITISDIKEVFVLREVLECTALKAAMPRLNDENEIRKIEQLLDKASEDIQKNIIETAIESDIRLHGMILKASGYKKLAKFLELLNFEILRARYIGTTVTGRTERSIQEHREILNALKKRDMNLAKTLLKQHIRNVRNNVLIAL